MMEVAVLRAEPPVGLPHLQGQSGSGVGRKLSRRHPWVFRLGLSSTCGASALSGPGASTLQGRRDRQAVHHNGRGLAPGVGPLAANTVRPQTQELYLRSVRQLLAWVGLKSAPKKCA